jgi:hypothetical protein
MNADNDSIVHRRLSASIGGESCFSVVRIMKKSRSRGNRKSPLGADEILPEYDFSRAARNQYASRYVPGSVVVVLEPDVAAAFPSSGAANDALRALAGIIQKHRTRKPSARRGA